MRLHDEIEKARSLPIDPREAWVIERRAVDISIDELEDGVVPDLVICVSPESELVIGSTVVGPSAGGSEILSWAVSCMISPMIGEPRRPGRITLVGEKLKELQLPLGQLGIQADTSTRSHPVANGVISAIEHDLSRPNNPPYLGGRGTNAKTVAEFFQAAAEFHKLRPWELFDYEEPIKVVLQRKSPLAYWAVVMGVAGEEFGINLFLSHEDLATLIESEDEEDAMQAGLEMRSLGFSYSSIDDIGPFAQAECLDHQWILADPSAYPSALTVNPKAKEPVRRPNAKELLDLTAAVLALNKFFEAHREEILDEYEVEDVVEIATSAERVSVSLSLPAPEFADDIEDEDEGLPFMLPTKPPTKASKDLARAIDMVNEALEEDRKSKRVKLAKEAIVMSRDCADAYLILAEVAARDDKEREGLIHQAIDAGRRAIGEDEFKALEGNFWFAVETRPYMRAKLAMAELRRDKEDMDGAIDEYHDMIRLCPNDNLGVRYPLASYLLATGRVDELEKLLRTYDHDSSAFWLYTRALLSFRHAGETMKAQKELGKAMAANKYVVDYLLERKPLPNLDPRMYSIGSKEEAMLYIDMFFSRWQSTDGAIEWLRKSAG